MSPVGLLCALGTALCYGVGSVLQAAAARDAAPSLHLDPRLLLALVRSWRYPVGLALDALGFVLALLALRSLPLYVVQSISASFVAVTAAVGALVLGLRLRRREVAALLAVVAGLTLVGLSAAPEAARPLSVGAQWLVLGATGTLVLAAAVVARLQGRGGAWALSAIGGLGFGVIAVAARGLSTHLTRGTATHAVHLLLTAPAAYAVVVATPLALVSYATALQRGTVVQATAPLVVGETVLPALAGLAFLGDHTRGGWGLSAVAGFVLAVGAALALAQFGEVTVPAPGPPPRQSGSAQDRAL